MPNYFFPFSSAGSTSLECITVFDRLFSDEGILTTRNCIFIEPGVLFGEAYDGLQP
jgi:hypothetical protein